MDDLTPALGARRSPDGRICVQLNLGLDQPEPTWVAVDAAHGQLHVEILDEEATAAWTPLT